MRTWSKLCLTLLLTILVCVWFEDVFLKFNLNVKETMLDRIKNNPQQGFLDDSGKYKIFMGVKPILDEQISSSTDLCLATQSTVDRLDSLVELLQNWRGPSSIALFVPEEEYEIAQFFINYLQLCIPDDFSRAQVHIVYPIEHPPTTSTIQKPETIACDRPKEFLDDLLDQRFQNFLKWRKKYWYPQNMMRNRARSGCHQASHVIVSDSDMIPYPSLYQELSDFLRTTEGCEKCAFVVPTYEVSNEARNAAPKNKSQLLDLIRNKKARPFHIKAFNKNQLASNLSRWEELPILPQIVVGYDVRYQFPYEPIFLSERSTPAFSEFFTGFGFSRNSQALEMILNGYRFRMLNNAFTYHWSFQAKNFKPKWRLRQEYANIRKMRQFLRILKAKYPRRERNFTVKVRMEDGSTTWI